MYSLLCSLWELKEYVHSAQGKWSIGVHSSILPLGGFMQLCSQHFVLLTMYILCVCVSKPSSWSPCRRLWIQSKLTTKDWLRVWSRLCWPTAVYTGNWNRAETSTRPSSHWGTQLGNSLLINTVCILYMNKTSYTAWINYIFVRYHYKFQRRGAIWGSDKDKSFVWRAECCKATT